MCFFVHTSVFTNYTILCHDVMRYYSINLPWSTDITKTPKCHLMYAAIKQQGVLPFFYDVGVLPVFYDVGVTGVLRCRCYRYFTMSVLPVFYDVGVTGILRCRCVTGVLRCRCLPVFYDVGVHYQTQTNLFGIFPVTDLTKIQSYNITCIQYYKCIHKYKSYLGSMLFSLLLYKIFRNMHVNFKKSYRCWPVSVQNISLFISVLMDIFVLKLSRSFL